MEVRVIALTVAICCTTSLQAQKKDPYKKVDNDVRLASLRHSQVWMPGDIASKNIRVGPQDGNGFQPEAVLNCEYVEEKQTGTPKFDCAIRQTTRLGEVRRRERRNLLGSRIITPPMGPRVWRDRVYRSRSSAKVPGGSHEDPEKAEGTRDSPPRSSSGSLRETRSSCGKTRAGRGSS